MNIAHLAKLLGGHVAKRDQVLCPGPGHTSKDRSLSVVVVGEGYLVHSFSGDDWKDCRDHVADLLGLGSSRFPKPSAEDLEKLRQAEDEQARKIEARALSCWKEAGPVEGTLAESYLREARGITCALSDSLRFHPECYHPSTRRLPALVARVDGAERFAIHRTYLRADGAGKADIEPAKAMLGAMAGGAVRLADGGDRLAVCEGIETGLSLASGLAAGSPTVWAALSTSGMKRLLLPAAPGHLLIATDGDEAGRAAGNVLAERADASGWKVSLLPAPKGRDWNDVLCMKGHAA